jgi:heat shock protein HtpX
MWELIRQNRRKSLIIFVLMGLCLLVLGYLVGAVYASPDGGIVGASIALLVWGIWSLISYFQGDTIVLKISGAREVSPDVHPQLFNVVEEMKIAAGLPAMPKVYIIDSQAPNAFATGRKPENCAVAVTAGLLGMLNRDELQGVVAHETGHILNRDIMFMTFAGIMMGTIVLISWLFTRSLFFGGGSSRRYRSSRSAGGGQAQLIIMIVSIVFAILAPIMARLLYLAISRRREYLADATAARLTRYPEGLASALEKMSKSSRELARANAVTAPMYIVNPLKVKKKRNLNLGSTHPPTEERVRILRSMSQGASLLDYDQAYRQVHDGEAGVIPASGLKDQGTAHVRKASGDREAPKSDKARRRDVGDLMRAVNEYAFLACASCGLRIKIPPDFKRKSFPCPRCQTDVSVPLAELAAAATVLEAVKVAEKTAAKKEVSYQRKTTGWESFRCSCGKLLQLSPSFSGQHITCGNCGTKIKIEK